MRLSIYFLAFLLLVYVYYSYKKIIPIEWALASTILIAGILWKIISEGIFYYEVEKTLRALRRNKANV